MLSWKLAPHSQSPERLSLPAKLAPWGGAARPDLWQISTHHRRALRRGSACFLPCAWAHVEMPTVSHRGISAGLLPSTTTLPFEPRQRTPHSLCHHLPWLPRPARSSKHCMICPLDIDGISGWLCPLVSATLWPNQGIVSAMTQAALMS